MSAEALYRRLEQRFDGEMPDHLRRVAIAGSAARLDAATLCANSRSCDRLALASVRHGARDRDGPAELARWRASGLAWFDLASLSSSDAVGRPVRRNAAMQHPMQ